MKKKIFIICGIIFGIIIVGGSLIYYFYRNYHYDVSMYDENDNIIFKTMERNGGAFEKTIEYYENGQIKSKKTRKKGKRTEIGYYEDGQIQYMCNGDNNRNEKCTNYYKNGKIANKMKINYETHIGEEIIYYENGQIKSICNEGPRTGECSVYDENGEKL